MSTKLTEAIEWFNTTFGSKVREKVQGTPFPDYFITAIALKETYYIWSRLAKRGTLPVEKILELCVGDIIDAPRRSAFPTTKDELISYTGNRQMFEIAHQSLLDLNVEIPDYRSYTNPDKFCHGFGIFQYDLQHFKTNPSFFLNRDWISFDKCLDVCLDELNNALKRTYGNRQTLTDIEMVYVAIAYNKGSADLNKGFNQGHNGTYGTEFHDYLIASKLRKSNVQTMFPVLRLKSRGIYVTRWQQFLLGQGFDPKGVDGEFGNDTKAATIGFQKRYNLEADGKVGNETYGQAAKLGFKITTDDRTDISTINFPPKPNFRALTHQGRTEIFGQFRFRHRPIPGNYENIEILDNWANDNIVSADISQLVGIRGANSRGTVHLHKKIVGQFTGLFRVWEKTGLLGRILTYDGLFVPRFKRGRATNANLNKPEALSNHSWGTAIDLNANWNGYGKIPALVGREGSIRELVKSANDFGFYWGGHFDGTLDGMHFEASIVKTEAEVAEILNRYELT